LFGADSPEFTTVFLDKKRLTTKPKGAIILSMNTKKYEELTRICGGNITPETLKQVFVDIEFQTTAVKQEFWQYMFEMGETFGDIQGFVVQDRLTTMEKNYA
jgi:hypothetical protein